jgi:hypothetical protein
MRFQEKNIIRNPHNILRNKDNVNVSMSSDFCEFEKPIFEMVGGDKVMTGVTTSDDEIHVIDSENTLDLSFSFIDNVDSFIDVDTTFRYRIYKYNNNSTTFSSPPVFDSGPIEWDDFSGTSAFTDSILVSELNIDGEYLIKGSYNYGTCTDILTALGDRNDTFKLVGDEFGLYEEDFDYYFAAINAATRPIFTLTPNPDIALGTLRVESFVSDEGATNEVTTTSNWSGRPIVSVNGITLFEGEDADFVTVGTNKIVFNGIDSIKIDDIITIAYVSSGNANGLVSESKLINNPIVSGVTGEEGSEVVYFNTDTNKYEIFTLTEPVEFNDLIITLNGITLANGGDYNQSSSDPTKVILNGELEQSDIITITYNSFGTFVGTVNVDNFDVLWTVSPQPINTNGRFILYAADDESFSANTIIYSATTDYVVNNATYGVNVDLSSYSGTDVFYKVVNEKNYELLNGDTISLLTDSEVVPITLQL